MPSKWAVSLSLSVLPFTLFSVLWLSVSECCTNICYRRTKSFVRCHEQDIAASSPTIPMTAFRDPIRAVSFTRTLSIGELSTWKWHRVEEINCPWPQEGHLSYFSECFKKWIVSQEQYFQMDTSFTHSQHGRWAQLSKLVKNLFISPACDSSSPFNRQATKTNLKYN